MKTLFNLFTILVIWLRIDGLNGDALPHRGICEVCTDSNDPNCLKVELKQCSSDHPHCMDAYFKPSSHVKSPKGRLIKQCGRTFCPEFNGTPPDICKNCINTVQDKCNKNKTIDYYFKLSEERRLRKEQSQQRNVSAATAATAVQRALSQLKKTASTFRALAAIQRQMMQKAEQQLARVHVRLEAALAKLHVTKPPARMVNLGDVTELSFSRSNAEASARLITVNPFTPDE